MNDDLSSFLKDFPFDPQHVTAKWVHTEDGRRMVQLRIDMGILQMCPAGRPDGTRPHGFESLLAYYEFMERQCQEEGKEFPLLDADACAELQRETMQYYHRYLALYALRDLDGVIRDTDHSLCVLEFVNDYSDNDDTAWQFMQFYPYNVMMNARACAEKAMESKDFKRAVKIIEESLEDIRQFWSECGEEEMASNSHEIEMLQSMLEQVVEVRPKSRQERLNDALQKAVTSEDYEKAARLRDELARLGSDENPHSSASGRPS